MTKTADILLAAARAVADSPEVLAASVETYGRGLHVFVGAYPSEIPDVKDAPFFWLMPTDETPTVKADRQLAVRCVLGVCPVGEEGEKLIKRDEKARTSDSNGLTVYGAGASVDALRDAVIAVLRDANAGAIVEDVSTVETDISHLPLEWDEFRITYREYAALSDN